MATPFVLAGKTGAGRLEVKMNRAWSDERVTVEWTFGSIIAILVGAKYYPDTVPLFGMRTLSGDTTKRIDGGGMMGFLL